MEVTVNQRIREFLEDNRISLNMLSKTLNMNQSTVLRQVKGEQTLSCNLVESFLEAFPDVSAEWLMRGKGTMYSSKPYEVPEAEPMMVAEPSPQEHISSVPESVWKAKYETIKECYDTLLSSLGGVMGKRHVG